MHTFKRIIALMGIIAMAVLFCACGNSNESAYQSATKMIDEGKYAEAAEEFEKLGAYQDATQMTMYAKAIGEAENGSYDMAIRAFESLGAFKDSAMLITYYQARQMEDAGSYDAALEAYGKIPFFKDSNERYESIQNTQTQMYENAIVDAENGSYDRAIRVFESLGEFEDSAMLITYYQARQMEDAGSYDAALEAYGAIPLFKDSSERCESIKNKEAQMYENAIADAENGSYDRAISVFESLGEYKDSAMLIAYYQARQMEDAGSYEAALEAYGDIQLLRIARKESKTYRSRYMKMQSRMQRMAAMIAQSVSSNRWVNSRIPQC